MLAGRGRLLIIKSIITMTSAFLLLGGTSTRRDGGGAAIRLVARAFSSTAPPSSTTRRHRQQQRPSVRIIDAVSDGGVCLTSSASARRQQHQQHPWSSMMPRRPFATGASSPSVGGRRGASSLGVASHDVEEDLDSALDDILDDVMVEAASDDAKVGIPKSPLVDMDDLDAELDEIIARNMPKAKAARREKDKAVSIDGAKPIPKVFVEEDDPVDYNDPDFLSTSNPHWVQSGMHQSIIDVLSGKGITKFTPVQAEAYLPVLAGRDVIGRSRTGTGKTLAFGIPALLRIERLLKESGKFRQRGRLPSMVVLCPTRELARQVQEEISQVCKPSGIFTTVFHGGVSYEPQSRDLRQGIDILVGTPGRVIDHIQRGNLNLSECNVVVLDEADEMLNMGFAEDVERVLDGVGSANEEKTQCLLFSATTPPWVKNIGRQYQKDVLYIDATSQTGGARTATTVRHLAVQVPPGSDSRKQMLEDIIAVEISKDAAEEEAAAAIAIGEGEEEEINPIASAAAAKKKKSHAHMQQKIFGKTIVFTEKKRDADELVSGGVFKSLTAQALHGDVGQKQRDSTLNAFRSGAFNVLVATDVAARGIDIQDVDLVIQFQPPRDPDTYVHRSGRTGRAGKKGTSIILFGPNEARDIIKIERSLGHGFRFELTGPPTIEAALTAAARTSALATQTIADDTSKYFKEAAADLLSNDEADPIDIVAKCLAAISRRSADVQSRSLLTGEKGIATLEMSNSRGRPVSPGDVMFTVSKLARMSRRDGDLNFESDVGKIKSNFETGTAFFDMDAEDANKLIEFSKDIDAGGAVFKILKEMEIERGRNFGSSRPPPGRGSGRGGRPGRGGPGGGKYQGGRGRSNGRGGGYGQSRGEYRGGGGGGGGGGGYHRRGDNRHNGSHEYGQGGRTGGVRERDGGGRYEGGGNRYGGSGGSRYGGSGGSRYGGGGGNSYGAGGGARQDRSGRGQGGNNDGW